ncbi:MAG: High molecular weight rubredoxin [Firmicutes bacterium]|nr:High molecular weight rubredoxin [Bacillota bacterium]
MDSKALFTISYGLYVIGSKNGDQINGQVANTVFQITSEPLTVAISINKKNLTHEYIQASGGFTVSVLSKEAPLSLIGQFGFKSGRDIDKFDGVDYQLSPGGIPYLSRYALAYLEGKVIQTVDVGTHTIFIGRVDEAVQLLDGEPMTYAYYQQIKRGPTPQAAPVFNPAPAAEPQEKYQCSICGYVYNPAQGDPENGVAPGTSFSKLPDDWTCPVCGAGKDVFEKIE